MCYCAALPSLTTRTRVLILQHPRERDMPIGTARMASLCLPRAELHVGIDWSSHAPLAAALADPAAPPILLYPGEGAKNILTDPPRTPVTLIVVDGTWSQAKSVVRRNPILQALPRYAFVAPEPSQYRIRSEPDDAYVSTIEAVMHVLGVLERDPPRFRALLDPLRAMVDAQLACQAQAASPTGRHARRRPRSLRDQLPAALFDRWSDLVLVAGEANAWPRHADASLPDDELVLWLALRPSTGESFSALAAPERPLCPSTPHHIDIPEAALRDAPPRAALYRDFAAFSRPSDLVAAWGPYGPSTFTASGGPRLTSFLDLRAAAKRLSKRKLGSLEHYADTLPIADSPAAPALAGRAGRRLALLARIVAHWRTLP